MKPRLLLLIIGGALLSVFGVMFQSNLQFAVAQSVPERRLLITPVRSEIVVEPGTVYKGSLTVKNTGTATLTVTFNAQAFAIKNEVYDYEFQPHSPINSWVTFNQDSVIVNAGESYKSNYIISVPNNSEPGGKYLSLFASAMPASGSGINSTARVGSLVYMTVPGTITKKGFLLALNSPPVITNDLNWSATLQNNGTAHFRSNFSVSIGTLFGQEIYKTGSSALILPATVRLVTGAQQSPQWIGLYKATYVFELGDNPEATASKYFLYLPLGQSLIVAALIGGSFTTIRYLRRKHSVHSNKN